MNLAYVRLAVVALAGLAVGAMTALATLPPARQWLLPNPQTTTSGEALIGGPFALTDQTGRRVTDADFRGRVMLVLFGSSASADTTPAALQVVGAALDRLGPRADRLVPLLISVDPARDTPERLRAYRQAFHPRLVALTGTPAEIDTVVKTYRVPMLRNGEEPGATPGMVNDPPALIYVMGTDGRYLTHLDAATGADAIAASLARIL